MGPPVFFARGKPPWWTLSEKLFFISWQRGGWCRLSQSSPLGKACQVCRPVRLETLFPGAKPGRIICPVDESTSTGPTVGRQEAGTPCGEVRGPSKGHTLELFQWKKIFL